MSVMSLGSPIDYMLYIMHDIVALFSGWLPNAHAALASHTILFNITNISFMLYLGLADATAIRVTYSIHHLTLVTSSLINLVGVLV
jgi:Na+-driven multidrug efflux pump